MNICRENKKIEIAVIVLCICILLPLLIISTYNRASADDYDYAILTHQVVENGGNVFQLIGAAFDTTVKFYNSWQGLYTSAFILSLQPAIFGESYYALSAPIVMLFAFVCMLVSVHILNKHFLKRSALFTVAASLTLLTVLILWLPSATEGLFWFNGAMNYMPFVFLNLLNLCLLLEAYCSEKKVKRYALISVCTLLSFLISGGNHVTAFANILFLLAITAAMLIWKKRFYWSALPFASAVIGFLVMYLAPGTAIRQASEGNHTQGVGATVLATVNHMRYILGDWIDLIWLLSLLLITPIAIEFAVKNKEKLSKRFPIFPILVSIAVICGMFCVPYLPLGNFGAGRVTNVIWITFMMCSWFNYVLIWSYLIANEYVSVEKLRGIKHLQIIKTVLIVACLLGLFIFQDGVESSNSYKAIVELKDGVAQSYCEEMDARFELYNSDELQVVAVPSLKVRSELLFFADLGTDPKVWPNTSISEYYRKSIYLIP